MSTAGRTVLFSATTVALSMAAMLLFPMYFLKSFAYAGVATVGFAAAAAIVVTPAAIWLLGDRLDGLDVRRLVRRLSRRQEPAPKPVEQVFWYRSTKAVMRRAVPVGLAVVGAPARARRCRSSASGGASPTIGCCRTTASAHQVGDQLRHDFAGDSVDRGHGRRARRRRPVPGRAAALRRRAVEGVRRDVGVGADRERSSAGRAVGPPIGRHGSRPTAAPT